MPGNIINITPADIANWPPPNYVDPPRRAWMPEYAGILFGAATIMFAIRLWLRIRKQAGGLGLDDVLLTCSWLCLTWFTTLAILGSEVYMTGRHVWDVPYSNYVPMARNTWIAELAFLLTGCCVKVSVLLFYRRLVEPVSSRYWMAAVHFAIAITVGYTLAFILALIFNCTPTDAYWLSFDPSYSVHYHCVDTTVINLLAGIMAVVSDLYSVALPCLIMRNLQLPRPQKIALNAIFCLGLLVVAASGVRTYYLWECGHNPDVTSSIFNVFVWSELELCGAIMCASAPALRVLFRQYFSSPISRLKRSNKSPTASDDVEHHGAVKRAAGAPEEGNELDDFGTKQKPTPLSSSSTVAVDKSVARHWENKEIATAKVEEGEESEDERSLVRCPSKLDHFGVQSNDRYSGNSSQSAGQGQEVRGVSWFEP